MQGISSAADPTSPVSCRCSVQGFSPDSRIQGDGSIKYDMIDDSGGTWNFMGFNDEVLVTWNVYNGSTNSFYKGIQTYQYQYTFSMAQRDECLDFSMRGGGIYPQRQVSY